MWQSHNQSVHRRGAEGAPRCAETDGTTDSHRFTITLINLIALRAKLINLIGSKRDAGTALRALIASRSPLGRTRTSVSLRAPVHPAPSSLPASEHIPIFTNERMDTDQDGWIQIGLPLQPDVSSVLWRLAYGVGRAVPFLLTPNTLRPTSHGFRFPASPAPASSLAIDL